MSEERIGNRVHPVASDKEARQDWALRFLMRIEDELTAYEDERRLRRIEERTENSEF